MELGRVFISSVFGGMLDLRKKATEATKLIELEPVLAEDHIAQPGAVKDALTRGIESCDIYVGVFDKRRGTIPSTGTDNRAITEQECLLAREFGLRRLVFLSTADPNDREPGLQKFLDEEVSAYETGVWPRYYDTPSALTKERNVERSSRKSPKASTVPVSPPERPCPRWSKA